MTEIDNIIADDLMSGDTIMVEGRHVTIVKRLDMNEELDNTLVVVLGDDDEEHQFSWDDRVTLYGY